MGLFRANEKNKNATHEQLGECVTDLLTAFWRHLRYINEQTHGKIKSTCIL